MTRKSMTDVAYDLMSKKKRSVAFPKLWADVAKISNLPNDFIAQFYTDLTLDSRFVSLKDNKWDLKERRLYAESHIDLDELKLDEEEESEEENSEELPNELISEENEDYE